MKILRDARPNQYMILVKFRDQVNNTGTSKYRLQNKTNTLLDDFDFECYYLIFLLFLSVEC